MGKQKPKKKARYELRLYIAGNTPKSATALRNLRNYCETHLKDQYTIDVIDLLVSPQLAAGDQILAVPTLVKKVPAPVRRIIGDLSDETKVLVGLDIRQLS
jgi:circadian clock protein KaiB